MPKPVGRLKKSTPSSLKQPVEHPTAAKQVGVLVLVSCPFKQVRQSGAPIGTVVGILAQHIVCPHMGPYEVQYNEHVSLGRYCKKNHHRCGLTDFSCLEKGLEAKTVLVVVDTALHGFVQKLCYVFVKNMCLLMDCKRLDVQTHELLCLFMFKHLDL